MKQAYIYDVIRSERTYQDVKYPNCRKMSLAAELLLLKKSLGDCIYEFSSDIVSEEETPEACLHELRNMAAILVRAMENHGAIKRM